jgi:hypothetical protein
MNKGSGNYIIITQIIFRTRVMVEAKIQCWLSVSCQW